MSFLDNQTLVLLNWNAVNVKPVRKALCAAISGKAMFIDHEDPAKTAYDFETWQMLEINERHEVIRHYSRDKAGKPREMVFRVPKLVLYTKSKFNGMGRRADPKISRRHVAIRDGHQCQYCGKMLKPKDVTLDHVIPRSKGGKHSWNNVTCACSPCNTRKADRTPSECGMKLRTIPTNPPWWILHIRYGFDIPECWVPFLH